MPAHGIQVGKKAPLFELLNQRARPVALNDLLGRWLVLYFYPKDDTPGCTTEACEFTDQLEDFQKLKARVVGVSPDSPQSHQKFIEKHKLALDLLSDPDHKVLEAYGAWGEKNLYGRMTLGVIRSTVIIDSAGNVAYHWPTVKAAGHAQAVAQKLSELQAG